MKIIQLTPGSGGNFYCENCLRDAGLIRALRKAGHEVLAVPLYLPPSRDTSAAAAETPIFFGGINVYLQQKLALFRKTPRWLDRMLDSPSLLRWAAGKVDMTDPQDLADTTISMLRGEDGRQVKELNRLAEWLASQQRPDVVCLSNALLLGLARKLKDKLGAPVVCMLQDEDIFLDALGEAGAEQAWAELAERACDADGFIAVSEYYRRVMIDRLHLPPDRVTVVPTGLDATDYQPADAPPSPPAVGFLERMCYEKGFDTLVEAFIILKSDGEFADLKLRASGGATRTDKPLIVRCLERLADAGLASDVELVDDFDTDSRIAMLRGLSVFSVPARHKEAFGLYVLEALAAGVPVVLPDEGAFGELVRTTGGGILCEPDNPQSLADGLAKLLADPDRARQMGRTGRQAVLDKYTPARAAERFVQACAGFCE